MAGRIENLKNFTKDDPRINRNGRPKKLPNLEKILIEVLGKEVNDKTQMEVIINRVTLMAKRGNLKAAEILMERGWGKVAQKMQILPPDTEPTKFVLPGGREIII